MSSSGRMYDFTLAAPVGSTQRMTVYGTMVKVVSATQQVVEVRANDGSAYLLYEGQGFRRKSGFTEIAIRNLSGVAQTGYILIGDDDFIDDRITGSVRVIDQAADKTSAGKQFIGAVNAAAGGAGVFGIVGVKAVGKSLAIRRVAISSSAAGLLIWGSATGDPTSSFINQGALYNKAVGSAVSGAFRFTGTSAAAIPSVGELPGRQYFAVTGVQASADASVLSAVDAPIIVPAGSNFWVGSYLANRDLQALFDVEEIG